MAPRQLLRQGRLTLEHSHAGDQPVAHVKRAALPQQAVVGQVDDGELAVALAAVGRRRGEALGVDQLRLELVDASHEGREQAHRPAAEVVVAQLELRGALEQQGEALARREDRRRLLDPGRGCLLGEQARAEPGHRVDRERFVRSIEQRLDATHRRLHGALVADDQQRPVRFEAGFDEPAEAGGQDLRLTRTRHAVD